MSTLKLSVLQQPLVWLDGEANLAHFDGLLGALTGRDLIVLPEMFTTGFAMQAPGSALPQSRVVQWLQQWAQQLNAMIGGSVALSTTEGAVNRFLLVEPQGKVHFYDKRHLFRMAGEHHYYVPVAWSNWVARAVPDQAESAGGMVVASVQSAIAAGAAGGGAMFSLSGIGGVFVAAGVLMLLAALLIAWRVRVPGGWASRF